MKYFLLLLLLSTTAHATVFWYADEVDRSEAIEYADRFPFDAIEHDDFSFCKYNCISLKDYNHFADNNPYDGHDPITASSDPSVLKRLRRDDFNRLADEDPYDALDADDFDYSDMDCWTLSDYNSFARKSKHDSWKPATLRDPDNFNRVIHKVGTKRYNFFDYRDLLDLR